MNKKNMTISLLLIILLFAILIGISGCTDTTATSANENINNNINNDDALPMSSFEKKEINIDKLEIYHFHGTNQCSSCIAVGDYAEATVNTFFKEELEKGIIVFDHINGELPENKELVVKYGATGSSLWLGTYKGEEFSAEQNTNVWYKINDKNAYMNYLKEVIEKKLAGN